MMHLSTSGAGKKILMRVDFDVPVTDGRIDEPFRIQKQVEAIHATMAGTHILLVAHISAVPSFEPLIGQLQELLGISLRFVKSPKEISEFLAGAPGVALLENIRQWPGEEQNDNAFAQQLAKGFDTYLNNAFAVSHREHASVAAVVKHLPSFAGPLIFQETEQLSKAIDAPADGKIVVMGGAKASTKIPVIKNLLPKAELVLIGGVLANDFLKAQGKDVQKSVVDDDIESLFEGIQLEDPKLVLPTDFVIDKEMFLDIGVESSRLFAEKISGAKIVIWNGPVGLFQDGRFMAATRVIAQAVAAAPLSIIGGGDTITAINRLGMLEKYSFVSTGGGAMLTFLSGQELPGLKALGYYG